MKLALVNNDGYDTPNSQERPSKRRKTEDHAAKDVIDGQISPSQTVQSCHGDLMYTRETGAPMKAIDSEKLVQMDAETLDISYRDAPLEDRGKPSPDGILLTQSEKSCVKAPGSAKTSIEREQQKPDLKVNTLAEKPAWSQTTEYNGDGVSQESSQAPLLQASRSINREDSDKYRRLSQSPARSPNLPIAEHEEVKVEGCPTQSRKAGDEGSYTGNVLLLQPTLASKDSVVSFPLCTSCRTKRVFNTAKNGETDILCKTCANAKKCIDTTTRSYGSPSKDPVHFQIPETPAVNRSSQQRENVSPGLERQSETIDRQSSSVNGLRDVDKSERWPFGPKLKSAGTVHRSTGGPILNQVAESPVTRRPNGPPQSEISVKDADVCPPDTPLTANASASVPIAVPPVELEVSLQDRVECESGRGCGLSKMKEEILAQTKTISDLRWRLQKANDFTTTTTQNHEQALRSLAQVYRDYNTVIKSMEGKHQEAIQAKEQELQKLKAELDQSKVESAKAVLSRDISISKANNDITSLRSQLAVQSQDQGNSSRILTGLKTEAQALKERLDSSEKSAKAVPKFIHTNLFDAAPELLAEHVFFDAEEKKMEIEQRPSKKRTFGRRLIHIRRERGQYPHREVYRHSPKPCEIYRDANICLIEESTGTVPAKRRALQDLGPGEVLEENVGGGKGEEKDPTSLEEMIGVPRNAIPCLVEGQLAYREGTRDAKGRLPRAKATYKVGRNVAGQLK